MSVLENLFESQTYFLNSSLGMILFIIFYALWVSILLPSSWISMLAGLIYGSLLGSIFVFIGATLGAILTFYSVRTFLKSWIQSRLVLWPKLKLIENTITSEGLKLIIMTRLSPAFPFGLLNLAYGISNVKFRDFLIGLLAIAPGTFLYCSLGSLAGEISRFNEILSNKSEWNSFFYTVSGILATALVVFILARGVNKALKGSN